MTLDGFLTFLTLLVAIYALVPPVARLSAKLGMGIQLPLAIGALLLVLYLEFFDGLGQPCPALLGRTCGWLIFPADSSVTPQRAAFLVVLIWSLAAWTIHRWYRPGAGSLPALSRLVDGLASEQRFSEVLKLLEAHLPMIGRAGRRNLPLQRLHDGLRAMSGGNVGLLLYLSRYDRDKIELAARRSPFVKRLRRWFGSLAVIIPAQRAAETAAEDIARVLFQSAELRQFIAQMRPYFAISLLRLDLHGMQNFSSAYFRELISSPGSVLYEELRQNQTQAFPGGYEFPESNRLLHFLFSDVSTAEKLGVWKPIGDHLARILRSDRHQDYVEFLNGRADYFDDECWQDPIFVGMHFFDLMVSAAAYQGVRWHMWLYYFPIIMQKLVNNYDTSNSNIDTSVEFPTRGARLIYEAIDVLGEWVKLGAELPETSPHRQIPSQFTIDNGNIPVSAAVSLGRCMRTIAMSKQIGDTFAGRMHEVIMLRISLLPLDGSEGQMRKFLIQSLIQGGRLDADRVYGDRLGTYFCMADDLLQHEFGDYRDAVRKAYPGAIP